MTERSEADRAAEALRWLRAPDMIVAVAGANVGAYVEDGNLLLANGTVVGTLDAHLGVLTYRPPMIGLVPRRAGVRNAPRATALDIREQPVQASRA